MTKTRSVRAAIVGLLLGTVALVGPAHPAVAQVDIPEVPIADASGIDELVDGLLTGVGDLVGSLAPYVEFTVDEEAQVYSFGASTEITGTYICDKTIALDETLPQLTSQSITVDLVQALSLDGVVQTTSASGYIDSFDVVCDNAEQEFFILALVHGAPLLEGPAEVVVRMTACDLLGCTTAAAGPTVQLSGETGDAFRPGDTSAGSD